MPLKFSTNLSTMFTEVDLEKRFARAENCGFRAFELQNPYVLDPQVIHEKMGSMTCDLLNFHGGSSSVGFASLPLSEGDFNQAVNYAIEYNMVLNFNKLHIMSGNKCDKFSEEDQFNTLVQTLQSLVDFLDTQGLVGLIEPICTEVNSRYFLNSFDMALEAIKQVNDERVKLLLDIYHLHMITKDVKKNLDIYYPYAGHIQISQDPGRKEPFCSDGKIDYRYVFDFLNGKGKDLGYIGLEYFPSGPTESTLGWIKDYTD